MTTENPPPPPPKRYRARLNTAIDVQNELARVYRQARTGEIDVGAAKAFTYVLSVLVGVMDSAGIDARLRALEDELTKGFWNGPEDAESETGEG